MNNLLAHHDENLASHLQRLNVSAGLLSWTLVSSLFTEFLSKEDWFKLMDYLFTFFEFAALSIITPVALLRAVRTSLLAAGEMR